MTSTLERPTQQAPARTYALGTAIVVGIHLVLWSIIMAVGWLYWDDFILQGQAARLGLSTDLLLNNHDGHVMPATYAVVWAIQEIGGLDYGLVAATMLLGELIFLTAAVLAFRTLLGRQPGAVVGLAVFLLTPILLPALTWWSAALTLVPLISCGLFATVTHVHYLRTGSRGWAITTVALVVVALAFFEKSLLIPFWLFLVTVLTAGRPTFGSSMRKAVTEHRRLWLAWAGLLVVYLIAFAQVAEGRTRLPTGPGQLLELLSRAIFNTLAAGLVGGPVRWTPVDYSASFADPPWWVILLGVVVTAAVVVLGVRRPGPARTAWVVAVIYLAMDLSTFAIGRLGPDGDPGVIQAGRYLATSLIPISIAVGTTFSQYVGHAMASRWRWAGVGTVIVSATLMLLSSLSYAAIWSDNPAKIWVGNARVDLAATDQQTPLLDQDVPDFLLLPVTYPYNQASWFLAPLRPAPGFSSSTDELQLLDNRGRLVPAHVDGAPSVPSPDGCYAIPTGGAATVPLQHELIAWWHTVRLDYTADSAGIISVDIGAGKPVTAQVGPGRQRLFVRAEGGESAIEVRSTDASLCIDAAEVGRVVPAGLPYGGSTDITDQLQQLQQ
jgi:hypothetical protein